MTVSSAVATERWVGERGETGVGNRDRRTYQSFHNDDLFSRNVNSKVLEVTKITETVILERDVSYHM